MSNLTRALVGATLVAVNLAGPAAIARPSDEGTSTQPQVTEGWNYYNQATRVPPAELKAWTQATDDSGTPTATPAPVAPARPAEPTGQPGWLVVSLGVLAAALAVVAGLAVLAARRATRTARPRQAICPRSRTRWGCRAHPAAPSPRRPSGGVRRCRGSERLRSFSRRSGGGHMWWRMGSGSRSGSRTRSSRRRSLGTGPWTSMS